jgi:DNA-directed RNA polymerase specialized sigma24 family protein
VRLGFAMSSEGAQGSVTGWFGKLQGGNADAADRLWERYFRRLVGLARKRLHGRAGAAAEEDVALSAFDSFCRQAQQGRFPSLHDRDSLWHLLVTLTARKAAHLVRDASRQKRGGGTTPISADNGALIDQLLSREPTPELVAQVADEYERMLKLLADADLERVAQMRLEGYTVEEIGEQLGYAPRSIKRKLALIRGLWEKEIGP